MTPLRTLLTFLVVVFADPAAMSLPNPMIARGYGFAVTPLKAKTMMAGAATDKITDAKFSGVKMPSRHLMAVMPLADLREASTVGRKDLTYPR